jgi:tetratricopeptide (TPR) repeat protein
MKPIPQFLMGCMSMVFLLALVSLSPAPTLAQTAQRYRQRAIELSRIKSWDQAIESYHKALDLEPNDPDTHYNLALTLK